MPDITSALVSFQRALDSGGIQPTKCEVDRDLFVLFDRPNGEPRLTYVRLQGRTVTVMVQFLRTDDYEGEPCFQVAWAVPEAFQGHKRAAEAFLVAVREMRRNFSKKKDPPFWVEGFLSPDNVASRRTAERVISSRPVDDAPENGQLQFLRHILAETDLEPGSMAP